MRRVVLLAMVAGCGGDDRGRTAWPYGGGDDDVAETSGGVASGSTIAADGSSTSGDLASTGTDGFGSTAASSTSNEAGTTEAVGCPSGHFCFELPGVFHVPDFELPDASYPLEVPAGVAYSVLELELDVTHGGWAEPTVLPGDDTATVYLADGLHSIFWLQRGHRDDFTWAGGVLGYVNVRGPSRNLVRTRHDLDHTLDGTPDPDAAFNIGNVDVLAGHTYRFYYRYDTVLAEVLVEVSEDGTVIASGTDVPTAERIASDTGFFIVFGHQLIETGPEVPTLGWTYADLRIELAP